MDSNTLYTQYGYDDAAHGYRLASVTYPTYTNGPNARTVFYDYGATGSADDSLNRLSAIIDDTDGDHVKETTDQVLASYQYLGLGTIVAENQSASGLTLDYFGDATTSAQRREYRGFDRFNRVVDEIWRDYNGDAVEEYKCGYDVEGNVAWKENAVADQNGAYLDELYAYDSVVHKKGTFYFFSRSRPRHRRWGAYLRPPLREMARKIALKTGRGCAIRMSTWLCRLCSTSIQTRGDCHARCGRPRRSRRTADCSS